MSRSDKMYYLLVISNFAHILANLYIFTTKLNL